ncbi:hypothetical protein AAFF_G00332030 [Aldrovandia affinis]|uniref:Uncharacterized protein n=1 Tax=Aldrovandia affinis TaxID=143900 RepID=A0AAD7WPN5_9TELE|nr:hypothetical protein AAFF_G00332030 [Aldrovandia affinis]
MIAPPQGRKQTAAGDQGDGDSSYRHTATIAGRRNSVAFAGDVGVWYELPPGARPTEPDPKGETYLYQGNVYEQGYADQHLIRNSSVPELSSLYHRPAMVELSRLYRDSVTIKMMPDGQHILSRDPSPARYGVEPPVARYGAEPPLLAGRPLYSDINGQPLDPRQPAPTCLVVDPASQGMDGTIGRGMMLRQETPSAYGMAGTAPQRMPYDPAYDASLAGSAVAPASAGLPPHHPQAAGLKRTVDPEFLAQLRAEGLAESTITLLLQQGFDSAAMLAVMEDHDVRSVAVNLGQARVLSRVVLNCKVDSQRPAMGLPAMRARSSSFSHRNDLYLQQQQVMEPHLMQQPPSGLTSISPRVGEFIGRRPSSAPSQHLLETTTYSGGRALAGYASSPGGYAAVAPQARPMYSAHTGLSLSAVQHPPSLAPMVSTMASTAPKTFSTNYTVPMELMKRAPGLPPCRPCRAPTSAPRSCARWPPPCQRASCCPPPPASMCIALL